MNDAAVLQDIEREITERVTPLDLYHRWEAQHWQIQQLGIEGDSRGWQALTPFFRGELLRTLRRFGAGEMAVTETLAPIAYAAPSIDYQIYLSTQIADEARHAQFFRAYLTPLERSLPAAVADTAETQVGDLFAGSLAQITDRIRREPQDMATWYEAVVIYHLLIEGTVAMTGLHTLLRTVREVDGFTALRTGLTNIARDESRHVNFGVLALRAGIKAGYGAAIVDAVARHAPAAASTMVDPLTRDTTPKLVLAMTDRPRQLRGQWDFAAASLGKRLGSAGLDASTVDMLVDTFRTGCADAVADYRTRHGVDHPASFASAR
ncbi:ribonucleotide-diphosphate reductase subunit beta [Nocardia thailandica]|uniref:ribonucleotide-diphosphate reductase subunit beta n=1 Tax=Nocardia thailandica TaxID=257275 RepID=UPI0005B9B342|nr:ribonucleotide-diphosphate reductase subunit beta [Nocardia thailandica]